MQDKSTYLCRQLRSHLFVATGPAWHNLDRQETRCFVRRLRHKIKHLSSSNVTWRQCLVLHRIIRKPSNYPMRIFLSVTLTLRMQVQQKTAKWVEGSASLQNDEWNKRAAIQQRTHQRFHLFPKVFAFLWQELGILHEVNRVKCCLLLAFEAPFPHCDGLRLKCWHQRLPLLGTINLLWCIGSSNISIRNDTVTDRIIVDPLNDVMRICFIPLALWTRSTSQSKKRLETQRSQKSRSRLDELRAGTDQTQQGTHRCFHFFPEVLAIIWQRLRIFDNCDSMPLCLVLVLETSLHCCGFDRNEEKKTEVHWYFDIHA